MSKYISEQFIKANETLKWLGIDNPFALYDIKVSSELEEELKKHKAVMIITPRIDSNFTLKDLVNKYSKSTGKKTYIWDNNSFYYDDTQEAKVTFIYMDDQGAYKNELGLYGTNKTYAQEIEQLNNMDGVRVVNIVDYIILQSVYRGNPLDVYTWTRFIGETLGARAFLRGGDWYGGSDAGVLALYLNNSPSLPYTLVGFRVSRDIHTLPLNSSDLDSHPLNSEIVIKETTLNGLTYILKSKL